MMKIEWMKIEFQFSGVEATGAIFAGPRTAC